MGNQNYSRNQITGHNNQHPQENIQIEFKNIKKRNNIFPYSLSFSKVKIHQRCCDLR